MQKQVLVLYATRRDAQLVTVGDRELPRILAGSLSTGVDYYSEVMDQARYTQDDYKGAFRSFLDLKYEGHRFDVVIAMDSGSLEFIETYRTELFPETPIVFFSDQPAPRRPPRYSSTMKRGGSALPRETASRQPIFSRRICASSKTRTRSERLAAASAFAWPAR